MVKYTLFCESGDMNIGILTISDKGSQGQRQDKSGEAIRDIVTTAGSKVVKYEIIPDEKDVIAATLRDWADGGRADVILTTGGTGLSKRDVTPEATLSIVDKEVPGIAEAMRLKSLDKTPTAMLSRAIAGQRGQCLIINLPGSTKAVKECLDVIMPALSHAVDIIKGEVTEHSLQDTGIK
jgi:molybdopterin adenylyltransferase